MKNSININQKNRTVSLYDDGNIPNVDLPNGENNAKSQESLPKHTRPKKDGVGGDGNDQ